MPKSSPINRLTASRRRRSVAKQRRLRLAVKRFAQLNLVMLSTLRSGAVPLVRPFHTLDRVDHILIVVSRHAIM